MKGISMAFAERDFAGLAQPSEPPDAITLRARALDEYLSEVEMLLGCGKADEARELVCRVRRVLSYATRKPS